jgi:glycosyltransferase involved in cell wall biosynthesis
VKIAYVLNTYPQPSHSFIRREIAALQAQGHAILRLAMRRSDLDLVDPQDRAEADQTAYILDAGALRLVWGLVRSALRGPRVFLRALARAWRMGAQSEAGRLRHLIYLAEAAVVRRACAEARIDHVHAHFGTNAAAVAHLARHLGGPTYSFTVHGPEEFDAPRALSLGLKMADAAFTVGVSQFGRSQLCRWADPEDWDRLHVVHCGIDAARFARVSAVRDGPRHVVSIGRFAEQKGQLVLIEALAAARAAGAEIGLRLVGDGPMRPEIEARIALLGLADAVVLTGWLDEDGVRAEIDAAAALVMPSFAEGLPMVIIEAMAAARPVIATYVAGIPELVRSGRTGWLVPAGDADALARALLHLVETPVETLRQMGDAGRERALARHDAGAEAARLAGLIAHGA